MEQSWTTVKMNNKLESFLLWFLESPQLKMHPEFDKNFLHLVFEIYKHKKGASSIRHIIVMNIINS